MVLAGLLLAGCGGGSSAPGPVDVAPSLRALSGDQAAVCARLVAALPQAVGAGLARRAVAGEARVSAAWGDPPVTLACGVPPADPQAPQVQLGPPQGGLVSLAVDDQGDATAYTTVGLPAPVTVTVPHRYDATLLVPVTAALLTADR